MALKQNLQCITQLMRSHFAQLNKQLLDKFCNLLMRSGNISKARGICTQGFNLFLQLADLFYLENKLSKSKSLGRLDHKNRVDFSISKANLLSKNNLVPKNQENHNFKQEKITPEHILHRLIENIRPLVEVRRVRVARATHQVPAQISKSKGQTLALRWIIEFANKRKQKDSISFSRALAQELLDAHKKQGGPRQRRSEVHRLAAANRSVMRYRWW